MKNFTLFICSVLFCGLSIAQIPSNATVYDCQGNSKNIYQTLSAGKSVIVLHKGVDCSICRNSAPGWQTWAAANSNDVDVWGAITYTYNASNFNPPCQKTTAWKSQYSWNDIFTFADSNRQWVAGGSPTYYVYSAIDSTIVYTGSNPTTARNIAIAQSTVGLKKSILDGSSIYYSNNSIYLKNLRDNIETLSIKALNGQTIKEIMINTNVDLINVENLPKGLYILNFKANDGKQDSKKLLFH